MKSTRFISTLLMLINLVLVDGHDVGIRDYLSNQKLLVTQKLDRQPHKRKNAQETIDFKEERMVSLPNMSNAFTFSMHGSEFVLANQKLFRLKVNESKILLDEFDFLELDMKIECLNTIEYKEATYMFVSFENGNSHIYRFVDFKLQSEQRPIQTIITDRKLSNAIFFVNRNSLYLLVSSNMHIGGNALRAPLILYKWEGSHFDEIVREYMESVIGLESFAFHDSEVIIVLRNNNRNSLVYQFDSLKLNKIQILDEAINAASSIAFHSHNKTYLIINDNITSSVLYIWRELEFVPVEQFDEGKRSQQVFLTHFGDTPLIISALKDKMHVLTVTSDSVQFLKLHHFKRTFAKMLSIKVLQTDQRNYLILIGLTEDAQMQFVILRFEFDNIVIENLLNERDGLNECLESLDVFLHNITSSARQNQQSPGPNHASDVLGAASSNVETVLPPNFAQRDFTTDMKQAFECVEKTLPRLEDDSKRLLNIFAGLRSESITTFAGKVIIQGALGARNLSANGVVAGRLNGIVWTPQDWLSYSKNQFVSGQYYVRRLEGKSLTTPAAAPNRTRVFKNLRVKNLKVDNLLTTQINDVPIESIQLKNELITGVKMFNNVRVKDFKVNMINERDAGNIEKLCENVKTCEFEDSSEVKVDHLTAENINGINFVNFYESAFKIGMNQTIRGNLNIPKLKVQHLQPKLLSGFKVEELFTTSTPQTVNSLLHFTSLRVQNVNASKINDLDFAREVAVSNTNSPLVISGHVSIRNLEIENDLYVEKSAVKSIGESLRVYNKKVKIDGNLYLENLFLPHPTKLFISGNEFNQQNFNDYWLKTTNQEIPVHFEAQKGISTPHLNVNHLNDVPIGDYMVKNNALGQQRRSTYIFENVTIIGDVIVNKTKRHFPDLTRLDNEAVKSNGEFLLRGAKTLNGSVEIIKLKADVINDIPTVDLLTLSTKNIDGGKIFKNVVVKSVNANKLITTKIGGNDLEDIRKQVVFIDEDTNLKNINLKDASVENLTTKKMNGKLFEEYMSVLGKIKEQTSLNKLFVKGNASISNIMGVQTINNFNISELIGTDGTIKSFVKFDDVFVNNLEVLNINDIDLRKLLDRLYYRVWSQNVSARHSFKIVNAPNIITLSLNNVDTSNLIDGTSKTQQLLQVKSGIKLANASFTSINIESNILNCNFQFLTNSFYNIPKRIWKAVQINNATLPNNSGELFGLFNNAVLANKNNFITSPVIFRKVIAENVFSRKRINDIDLEEIVNDALVLNQDHQNITGFKNFTKLSASRAIFLGDAFSSDINGLNITEVDSQIIRKSKVSAEMIVKGRKTMFGGLETNSLETPVALDVKPESLVSFRNSQPVPKCAFSDLTITNDFYIGTVNNINFSDFLADRLLLKTGHDQVTNATYFLSDVQLDGKTTIQSINDIKMEDIVFDQGTQIIYSPKRFTKNLVVAGDITIETINGINLDDVYDESVVSENSTDITGNIIITEASEINGRITTKKINTVPMETINEYLHSESPKIRAEIVNAVIKDIGQLVSENAAAVKELPDEYLYLMKSDKMQIELENTMGGKVIKQENGAMMHVLSSKPGSSCGLPSFCSCVTQNSVLIGNDFSINFLNNKNAQRVYTFETPNLHLFVVTNTHSRSNLCRASNTSNEITSINWVVRGRNRAKENHVGEQIVGYISDVDFFAMDEHVYVILARQYDPNLNSNAVDSLVYQIYKDGSNMVLVQKLRTVGASTLHIFHTAQGINMIIGNSGDPLQNATVTNIYRFNKMKKMFDNMRSVSSSNECLSSASIVLGSESFIILAYANNPMMVLKHNEFYDNYYIYESSMHNNNVSSVSVFYIGGIGKSDAYLTAVSEKGYFYIFSFNHLLGFRVDTQSYIEGLNALVPIYLDRNSQFLFASSKRKSSLLTIVKYGVS